MDVWYTCEAVSFMALDAALRAALGEAVAGISLGAPDPEGRRLRVHFVEQPTPEQAADAAAVIAAHDPVFLSVDRDQIGADGADEATLTVLAQNPVTLTIGGQDVELVPAGGAAAVGITSDGPQTILISVKDGANRCASTVEVRAV